MDNGNGRPGLNLFKSDRIHFILILILNNRKNRKKNIKKERWLIGLF